MTTAPGIAGVQAAPVTDAARSFVTEAIESAEQPVVMFALEWCEFCWSVRKMFAELGIAFRDINLDSVEFQQDNLGADIRAALLARVGSPTIPQVFVGGDYIGGATETLDAFNRGALQRLLVAKGIDFDDAMSFDANGFLPKWLQPRGAIPRENVN